MKTKHLVPWLVIALIAASFLYLYRQTNAQPDTEDFIDRLVGAGLPFAPHPVDVDLLESRKIVLTTDVNPASAQKIISALLLLDSRDHEKPIDLYLRTEGGWVSDAFAVIDTFATIKAPVNTHAMGATHSAGAMILAAGTGVRLAHPYASIMFHAGLYEEDGPYGENTVDNARLVAFWTKHAALPAEWLNSKTEATYFFTPEKALAFGIVDRIAANAPERSAP